MFDPEAKPNMTAYTIDRALIAATAEGDDGASSDAGNQNVKEVAEQIARAAIMLLKRPSLSARKPGTQRPTQLPALKMARSW